MQHVQITQSIKRLPTDMVRYTILHNFCILFRVQFIGMNFCCFRTRPSERTQWVNKHALRILFTSPRFSTWVANVECFYVVASIVWCICMTVYTKYVSEIPLVLKIKDMARKKGHYTRCNSYSFPVSLFMLEKKEKYKSHNNNNVIVV